MAPRVAFLLAFGVFAATTSAGLGWLDSPEFVAAAADLGVPHSPGHPLQAMLGWAITLLPVGDVAFRVNLLSALLSAVAVALLTATVRRIGVATCSELHPRIADALAVAVALTVATSTAVWMQATRAEVYGLEFLLLAAALYFGTCVLLQPSARSLAAFGFVAALGLATHHFITLTLAVPWTIALLVRRRAGLSHWASAASMGVVGLTVFAYLPVRAAALPVVDWGHPDRWQRLLWTVSGRAFTGSLTSDHVSTPTADGLQIVAVLLESATALVLLAVLATYLSLRSSQKRTLVAVCWGVVALTIAGRATLGFDPETPDHHAYLVPAVLAVAVLAMLGVTLLAAYLPRAGQSQKVAVASVALLATFFVFAFPARLSDLNRAHEHAADQLARATIDAPPPRALVLTSYFQTSFRLAALRAAEGARPDLSVIDRSFLTYPGELEAARARHPQLGDLLDAGIEAGTAAPITELDATSRERPILIELHINLDVSYLPHLNLDGAFARWRQGGQGPGPWVTHLDRMADETRGDDRVWLLAHRLWVDYLHLVYACERSDRALAAAALAHGEALAPGDELLRDTASACGIPGDAYIEHQN